MKTFICAAAAALALGAASCTEPSIDDGFDSGNGITTFRLTDAPFPYDRVKRVDVYVVRVDASWAADTMQSANADFRTVATVNRAINLLDLTGGITETLGADDIPKGAIKALRLIIDTDKSSITMKDGSVLTGSSTPGIAWQSSAGIATLNATVDDNISIPDGGTGVILDFDVGKAFLDPADLSPPSTFQGFIFSPVLRAAEAGRTGFVSGLVRSGTSVGPAVSEATVELKLGDQNNPENTWSTVATTRSKAAGEFQLGWLTRTAFYAGAHPTWTYMVVVTQGTSRAVLKNVSVFPGQDTKVGSLILPTG